MIPSAAYLMKLPPAERQAAVDGAWKAAFDELRASQDRAIAVECKDADFRRWQRQNKRCLLLVRHEHPSTLAVKVSRDGGGGGFEHLPLSQIEVLPQSDSDFLLAITPQWLRETMPTFCTSALTLAGDHWTDAQRDRWSRLGVVAGYINNEIWLRAPQQRRLLNSRNRPRRAALPGLWDSK